MSDLTAYIANLENYSVKELQQIWRDYFEVVPEQVNKPYLVRGIAYRVQELRYGGLRPEIIKVLNRNLKDVEEQLRTKMRQKPGVVLTRLYKGIEFRVTIVEGGFEFNGMLYRSLTKIASIITDSKTSGPLFFGVK
ncbi:MAG: DUF2924 domain-containing protein [Alphaproteobacteria bacterium]